MGLSSCIELRISLPALVTCAALVVACSGDDHASAGVTHGDGGPDGAAGAGGSGLGGSGRGGSGRGGTGGVTASSGGADSGAMDAGPACTLLADIPKTVLPTGETAKT